MLNEPLHTVGKKKPAKELMAADGGDSGFMALYAAAQSGKVTR